MPLTLWAHGLTPSCTQTQLSNLKPLRNFGERAPSEGKQATGPSSPAGLLRHKRGGPVRGARVAVEEHQRNAELTPSWRVTSVTRDRMAFRFAASEQPLPTTQPGFALPSNIQYS